MVGKAFLEDATDSMRLCAAAVAVVASLPNGKGSEELGDRTLAEEAVRACIETCCCCCWGVGARKSTPATDAYEACKFFRNESSAWSRPTSSP